MNCSPLVPLARQTYRHAGIRRTNCRFKVIEERRDETLRYLPNEQGGVTMLLPSDYGAGTRSENQVR